MVLAYGIEIEFRLHASGELGCIDVELCIYIVYVCIRHFVVVRDWSSITSRGATKREGGASEVLPLRKGAEKVLEILKVGEHKSYGVVLT